MLGGFGADAVEFGLAPTNGEASAWYRAEDAAGRFTARIPTVRADLRGVLRPVPAGGYELVARVPGAAHNEVSVLVHEPTIESLPQTHITERAKVKLSRAWPNVLNVELAAPVPEEILGRYTQNQLIEAAGSSSRELENAVFFCVDLGLNAGQTYGVPLPLTSLTRDLVQTLIGHGYTDQDFATLLLLQAKASGIELQPENVEIGDGLSAESGSMHDGRSTVSLRNR